MERLQLPFFTSSPDIDETPRSGEKVCAVVSRLAEEKTRYVAMDYPDALIIGSDQVVECSGRILTKPITRDNAIQQLSLMSGKTLVFHTGLCVLNNKTKSLEKDVIECRVTFRNLSNDEIERYLNKENSYNCAGSFKSEALGITLLERMDGDDPTALIGLPLIRLCKMLRNQGVTLP